MCFGDETLKSDRTMVYVVFKIAQTGPALTSKAAAMDATRRFVHASDAVEFVERGFPIQLPGILIVDALLHILEAGQNEAFSGHRPADARARVAFLKLRALLVITSMRPGGSEYRSGYLALKYSFMSTHASWYPPPIKYLNSPSLPTPTVLSFSFQSSFARKRLRSCKFGV